MAEDKPNITKPADDAFAISRDDMSALEYVLEHVKGSSPSSLSPFAIDLEDLGDE